MLHNQPKAICKLLFVAVYPAVVASKIHMSYWTDVIGDFTYSFKYPVLIVAVLLGVSLVLSICIDALKKYTGYDKLTAFVIKKAT